MSNSTEQFNKLRTDLESNAAELQNKISDLESAQSDRGFIAW